MPEGLINLVRDRGCVIFRNVVSREQAEAWESELKDYTRRHKAVGGFPANNPQSWSLWWTRPQVQIRSHPRILAAVTAISKLWRVSDPTTPVDLATQVAYPDRFRIRYPTNDAEFLLNAHMDSGSTGRWEDPVYRANYQAIFDGEWENLDSWNADNRIDVQTDLYHRGHGTLRLLPSLKASLAYLMLRPFFLAGADNFDDKTPTFPGAEPGMTQLLPTDELHPDLKPPESMVSIPPVAPGDYVFWDCNLLHEVDKYHPGTTDSSVVYNACTPLSPYNIVSLRASRQSFLDAKPPRNFNGLGYLYEEENSHEGHGARKENIMSRKGMQAMGFESFDVDEPGISEGARRVRIMANETLAAATA